MYCFLMRGIQTQSIIADITDEHEWDHDCARKRASSPPTTFANKIATVVRAALRRPRPGRHRPARSACSRADRCPTRARRPGAGLRPRAPAGHARRAAFRPAHHPDPGAGPSNCSASARAPQGAIVTQLAVARAQCAPTKKRQARDPSMSRQRLRHPHPPGAAPDHALGAGRRAAPERRAAAFVAAPGSRLPPSGGRDPRLLVIVGPCSVHDPDALLEFAAALRDHCAGLDDALLPVLRVYFEKPRTVSAGRD
jgi:hypothetical protein